MFGFKRNRPDKTFFLPDILLHFSCLSNISHKKLKQQHSHKRLLPVTLHYIYTAVDHGNMEDMKTRIITLYSKFQPWQERNSVILSRAFCLITAKLVTPYPSMILVFFLPVPPAVSNSFVKALEIKPSLNSKFHPSFFILIYSAMPPGITFVVWYASSLTVI